MVGAETIAVVLVVATTILAVLVALKGPMEVVVAVALRAAAVTARTPARSCASTRRSNGAWLNAILPKTFDLLRRMVVGHRSVWLNSDLSGA